ESSALSKNISIFATFGLRTLAAAALCAASGVALTQDAQAPLAPLSIEGDAERGELLAETCSGCHGIPGYRNAYPSFHVPKLGGQNQDYLEVALQGYRRGTRGHQTMQAQAAPLTDQDIADLAAYLSGLEDGQATGISRASADAIRAGQEAAATCAACHGEAGISPAPQWPNLAGQHQSYLMHALTQYKSGQRKDMVMAPLVAPLDDETIEQLAAYFASQPGLYTTDDM
ncbi:MAG: cytochrome c, partial [Gammaproteobacteria bacterium]|nr:cytochrome c [Gammaproteobacteria bacterium]